MRNIKQIKNLKGKRVLVRVDFNVPVKDGKVEDDFRIKKALPTIEFLSKKGAKVILISHLGKDGSTLLPVYVSLKKLINVTFVPEVTGDSATEVISSMKNGEIVLLENLRRETGEQAKDNIFAKKLAELGDIYVNDAFPVSHREDASIVLLPKLLPHFAGFQIVEEVSNLSLVFKKPKHPFLFILGGAKFSTKMPLIKKYLKLADHVFVGGALANDFLKAKGYEVGDSLVDTEGYGIEKLLKNKKLLLPIDVVVKTANGFVTKNSHEVLKGEVILDIGEKSVKSLDEHIRKAKLILWNGPLGKYESGGGESTKKILKNIAKTKSTSIIGGGDTVVFISEMKMEKKFTFVSTGGGATLDFLAKGTLPGIKALN